MSSGGHPHVAYREDHENQRLDQADDAAQSIKRYWHQQVGQAGKQSQHMMVSEHVGEQTNPQRERPEQIVRYLNYHHEPAQPPQWPKEAEQVLRSLVNETLIQIINKADSAQRESQIG